jgi:hypothetical protein
MKAELSEQIDDNSQLRLLARKGIIEKEMMVTISLT